MSPVYSFRCESGHTYDRRVEYGVTEQDCPISKCTAVAKAGSVYALNHTHPRFWGGDIPREVGEARDEYLAHARSFRAGLAEEKANGWDFDHQPKTF